MGSSSPPAPKTPSSWSRRGAAPRAAGDTWLFPAKIPTSSTPVWWTPSTTFDLRDTTATFYLKELEKITVAEGYAPYVFIAAYIDDTRYLTTWRQLQEVSIGVGEWEFNRIALRVEASQWLNYACTHPDRRPGLDYALSHCGFFGIMYQNGPEFRRVHASGVLGLDELRYNMPLSGR